MFGHQNDDDNKKDNPALPTTDGVTQSGNPALPKTDQPAALNPAPAEPPKDDTTLVTPAAPAVPPAQPTGSPAAATSPDDLLDIKQQALSQLSPLVDHLDQTPEEKFRTTMMMIQASDDQALVKDAYEAAKQITDEKTRAQALLDIVNEINYFTQHKNE